MNKAFLFVIMLVSTSFVGCIEDSDDGLLTEDNTVDETTQEDETITPVGTNETPNMAPYVDAGVWIDDDFQFFFDETEEGPLKYDEVYNFLKSIEESTRGISR